MMTFRVFMALFLLAGFIGFSACSDDNTDEMPELPTTTIYAGSPITFEKVDGADPTDAANQDRITDNVWITRGNDGGQIYNAKSENNSNKNSSPAGTQWAVGNISEVESLTFSDFRDAIKPKDAVGVDMVLFLTEEEIFIPIKFTKWSVGKNGGFAYERATE
ncbi:MAG: hypothetical protein AAGJ18_07885 [Bacteroidota bacterium]